MKRTTAIANMYEAHGDKLRFLVVGMLNTAIGYGLFVSLLALLGPSVRGLEDSAAELLARVGRNYYIIVQWVAWVLAVPLGTVTMKYLAFRSPGHLPSQIGRAYLVYLPQQGVSSVILWFTVAVLHLIPQVGQLAAVAIATIFSYLGHKYFTFRVPDAIPDEPSQRS